MRLRVIAADYLAGGELEHLAEDHGLEPGELESLLAQAGFLPIGAMARRYWRREPMARIAESFEINERTLYRVLARYGIERNSRVR
ncbi:hypothetical protein ABT354_20140 [Streptomyces sp. NPDC000594]|uniref:hypothetical protein n=1 Tax=Streptomyces sp. NPDC000594 TaxID=3154261 RepID=UPI0033306A8D